MATQGPGVKVGNSRLARAATYSEETQQSLMHCQLPLVLRLALDPQNWPAAAPLHLPHFQMFPRCHPQPPEHPAQIGLRLLGPDLQLVRCLEHQNRSVTREIYVSSMWQVPG